MPSAKPDHPSSDLAAALGLAPRSQPRLAVMPLADVNLPDRAEALALLEWCSVAAPDRDAMLAARPDETSSGGWWQLLRAAVGELRSAMDTPLPAHGYVSWPTIPESAGPTGMFLYAWALLAVVPELIAVHARRGIDPEHTRASLADLGGVLNSHHQVTGVRGVGLFPLWGPPQSFCGRDITLGRHSFTRTQLALGDGPAGWVLQVHVPPTGPLTMAASRASIDHALGFFAEHYPDEPVSALVCTSWMLDPTLARYLPAEGNILRFQQQWRLLPHVPLDDAWEGDRELMRLGLQVRTPDDGPLDEADLARIPQQTRLQRGFVEHLRTGGHWHKRTGIRWLR